MILDERTALIPDYLNSGGGNFSILNIYSSSEYTNEFLDFNFDYKVANLEENCSV